jgi:hypothetical protein
MKRTIDKFKDFLKKKKKPEAEPKVDHRKEFEKMLDKYGGSDKIIGTSYQDFD